MFEKENKMLFDNYSLLNKSIDDFFPREENKGCFYSYKINGAPQTELEYDRISGKYKCGECGTTGIDVSFVYKDEVFKRPKYCPNCGRLVV